MRVVLAVLGLSCCAVPAAAQTAATVFLEELTWTEVRDAVRAGTTTVIIPTGGTEQNGPHMVLGKHNYLVKYKAGEIAKRVGRAFVAPVIAYVPEGAVDPPTGHMRFAGTITTPQDVFQKVLEYGVVGNPALSTVEYGRRILEMQIDAGARQLRALRERARK